jgi:hypothetical protein
VKMLLLAILMLVSSSLLANFDTAYTAWKSERYEDAVPLLLDLRQQPYGKEMRIDYMLGTCYCRISGQESLGKIYLKYAYTRYPYTDASGVAIKSELEDCTAASAPRKVVFSTLNAMGGSALPGVNSKMFYSLDKRDKVISNNMMEVKHPLSEQELAARKLPLSQPGKAEDYMRSILGQNAKTLVQGHFVYGSLSRHNISDLKSIAQEMNQASQFFNSTFDVQLPDDFIAVFLVPSEPDLKQLAKNLHHLELQDDTLGYSFQNDNSMVAINNSSSAGTLKHELAHFLVRRSFGDIPPWFDEGLASLYEVSYFDGEDLVGLRNWREGILLELWFYPGLDEQIGVKEIAAMNWADFNQLGGSGQAQAIHHALARYFVLFLQNQRYLPAVYKTYSDREMDQRIPDIRLENEWVFKRATDKSLSELYQEFRESFAAFQKSLTRDEVKAVQAHLQQLGYSPGTVDGRIGKNTRAAINELFRDKGLPKIYHVDSQVIDKVLGF